RREHPLYRTTINYQTPTNNCDEETYILFNSRHAVFAACPARPGNNHQSRPDVDGSGGIHHGRTRYLVFRFRQRPPTGRWRGSLPVDMGTDQPDRQSDSHRLDRKSTRLNSSHVKISYAVFCLKKKTTTLQ